MDFRVLGPVEARTEDQPLSLGGPRQRALLAYLLLNAGEPVPGERLVDELWYAPPAAGVQALHTQVSRLRRALGGRIATTSSGYVIELEPGELDLDRFRALLAEAGATQDPAERSKLLREGDALWHGSPLDGIEVPFAAAEVRALEELRVTALEERIESDLEAGRHAALVSELSSLVARYPLREELRGQLILALYRSGRQAEALEAFREARRMLSEELGLEPSLKLRELERAILRQDPALESQVAVRPTGAAQPVRERRRWAWSLAAVLLLGASAAAAAALIIATEEHTDRSAAPPSVVIFTNTVEGVETHPSPTRRIVRTKASAKPTHLTVHHVAPVAAAVASPKRAPVTPAVISSPKPLPRKLTTKHTIKPTPSRPTSTTPAVTKIQRQAPKFFTVSDTFGGTQIDSTIWYEIHEGTGWDMSEHDGHLEFTIPPTAATGGAYNAVGGHVGTQCKFPGDFDARVDFNLVSWPSGNGLTVTLWSFLGPNNLAWQAWRASHTADQGGEQFGSWFGAGTSLSLDDPSGTLRIARKNGLVTGYFWHNGRWDTLTSGRNNQYAKIGVGIIGTSVAGLGGQSVVVDFTNFSVTGANPACPPGSNPPAS